MSAPDEVPELGAMLELLIGADRSMLRAVAALADLLASAEVDQATGVGLDHWLAVAAAQTRMDRRMLVRTCRLLHRLPTLDAAVRARRLSFAQLRGVSLALRGCPAELDDQVDAVLAALLDGLDRLEHPDPDVLVRQLADAVDELRAEERAAVQDEAAAGRYLALQPFLDGTGGTFNGQLDAAGLALLDAATTPPDRLLDAGLGAARADTLLARLAGSCGDGCTGDASASTGDASEPTDDALDPVEDGPRRASSSADGDARWQDGLAPPKLLVRLPFETLLDGDVPADLLTRMLGGRVRLTAGAARRLLDARGADLRTLVIDDDGTVIGVGRASRRPPGWLADAVAAVHDTCTGPGCDRPARGADHDHARPWWPARPDDEPGPSDLDNLGPLCASTNRQKEEAGWRVVQTGAGIRTWRHERSGLVTTTVPSTWRPPGDPRRGWRRRRPPPRPEPPGPLDGLGADGAVSDPRPPPGDDPPFPF